MSSKRTDSPSDILKKLAKVPLLCNVLEKQMYEETQDRDTRHSVLQTRQSLSSVKTMDSNLYFANSDHESQSNRRHSMPNWGGSHTITSGSYHPVHGISQVYEPQPFNNHMSRYGSDSLYPLKRIVGEGNSGNNPPKASVISHLDLESNYNSPIQTRNDGPSSSYTQRHYLSSHAQTNFNSTTNKSIKSQFIPDDDAVVAGSCRRASAPPYLQHKRKNNWDSEDVFVESNESFGHLEDRGNQGLKRRHYSEFNPGESSYSNKKIRRTSGPDSRTKSQPQQNRWSRETSRRSSSPHPVELPFTLDTLTDEIMQISTNNAQSPDLLKKKELLRSVLESIFRQQFPGCSLHLVGSSVNGFGNKSSDADFCLMLTQWREIDQRREARKILLQLNKLLQRCDFVEKSHVIFATVPIIKFVDRVSKCECDININNHVADLHGTICRARLVVYDFPTTSRRILKGHCQWMTCAVTVSPLTDFESITFQGIRNTFLLKAYCEVEKRLCPLVMVIKKWAKTHGINEAKDGTLSSYALTLMTIHFLQCGCKPPVLPSLQQMFPDFFSDDGNVQDLMKLDVQKFFQERNISRSQNVESLGELLLGFFQYFSNTFSWSSSVISVRLGRVYSTEFGVLPKNKYIYIEEPFDSNNVAKTVYNSENFNKIKMKISLAANKLRVSPSLKSII